ncbi:hypothetical protein ACFX5Q_26745 [Mesorhizobium sp. IMUNJ 23033]|uniref:hypothetical protein n=1 Tax=Mesorhizobium sp. IMUNJ 23033 TaxID=3378039 RepID=UPI00384DBD2D
MANSKETGRCIFCGGNGLTKEHIWPDWLAAYAPKIGDSSKHTANFMKFDQEGPPQEVDRRVNVKQGDPRSKKLRCVCRNCNGGWMSRLQSLVKPVLLDLVLGNSLGESAAGVRRVLTPEEQHLLSKWAVMFTMVAEHLDYKTIAVPTEQRRAFAETQCIPENWRVWIGRYQGWRWHGNLIHRAAAVTQPGDAAARMNLQTSAFAVGKLFLLTWNTTVSGLDLIDFIPPRKAALEAIWPSGGAPCSQPTRIIFDFRFERNASLFFEYLGLDVPLATQLPHQQFASSAVVRPRD